MVLEFEWHWILQSTGHPPSYMRLKEEERQGLLEIRRLKRTYWTLFLSIPILVIATQILARVLEQWAWICLILVPFVWGIRVQQRLIHFRCPRCREPFFYDAPIPLHATSIPSQKKCQHCGLSEEQL